jgi:hypothetical protein
VFDRLLPEPHNSLLLSLLFVLAEWHAYAKLRLHTETTISFLETATTRLGSQMRRFDRHTREHFPNTKDLPKEVAARIRRQARTTKNAGDDEAVKSATAKKRYLNLNTYKWHAIGYTASSIRVVGTTDNPSTHWVCSFF